MFMSKERESVEPLPERWSAKAKTATVLWFFAVYVGFLVLLVFSEVLVIFLVFPLLPVFSGQGSPTHTLYLVYAIVFGLYLILLKGLLPVIDLILDIGNYHLASDVDRRKYHERIEQAVESLLDSGCREIHILAHSLGSVITYDWPSPRSDRYAVTVLHTIGSPLNKFWYIDHSRPRRHADREGLARRLGGRWTNYWAWSDVVSGLLARYGTSRGGVANTRLRWLGPVLLSHVRYWTNLVVFAGIRHELDRAGRR